MCDSGLVSVAELLGDDQLSELYPNGFLACPTEQFHGSQVPFDHRTGDVHQDDGVKLNFQHRLGDLMPLNICDDGQCIRINPKPVVHGFHCAPDRGVVAITPTELVRVIAVTLRQS